MMKLIMAYVLKQKTFRVFGLAGLIFSMTACSTYRPILDDNAQYNIAGASRAEADIDDCMKKAEAFLESHNSDRMKKEAGRGAVSGAIVGGLWGGLVTGKSSGLITGAATGAGVGALSAVGGEASKDNLKPDEVKQRYISNCLKRKNYEVIGWK